MPHTPVRMAILATPILALGLLLGTAWGDGGLRVDDDPTRSITSAELKDHVDFLADDEREGRYAGSPGGRAAGEYIAEQLAQYGVEPGLDGSYFQEFGKGMRNVVGVIRGSDPELGEECLVLGAHYDHVGRGSPGRGRMPGKGKDDIYNGADDNASGTSGVLEIAEAFSLLPAAPRRSIVFVLFDAEERGLVGSLEYTRNPIFPLEKTVAMVNLDMIGRGDKRPATLYGPPTGEGLEALVAECNEEVGARYDVSKAMMYASDHANFVRGGVPVLFFFTGLHSDYHRPSDHADKIEHAAMEKICRLSFLVLQRLANDEGRPAFRAPPRPTPRPPQRPILGVYGGTDEETGRYKVERVMPDRPATRAGLKQGDVILTFRGVEIDSGRTLRATLRMVKKDETVEARILRDGKEMTIRIPFGTEKKKGWY